MDGQIRLVVGLRRGPPSAPSRQIPMSIYFVHVSKPCANFRTEAIYPRKETNPKRIEFLFIPSPNCLGCSFCVSVCVFMHLAGSWVLEGGRSAGTLECVMAAGSPVRATQRTDGKANRQSPVGHRPHPWVVFLSFPRGQ
jgi:hypothetical protein